MKAKIHIGIGKGNNGGGGLVAARRLAGWGFQVLLDIPDTDLRSLPGTQLGRTQLSESPWISHPDSTKKLALCFSVPILY